MQKATRRRLAHWLFDRKRVEAQKDIGFISWGAKLGNCLAAFLLLTLIFGLALLCR